MPQLTVGRKLGLSFAVLGVFLVIAIVAALSGMSTMATAHHGVAQTAVPKQLAADAARSAAADMHYSQTEYALDGGRSRSNYADDHATFEAALAALGKRAMDPSDRAGFEKIKAAAAAFDAGDTKLYAAVKAGDHALVVKTVNGPENDASDNLVSALTDFQGEASKDIKAQTAHFDSVDSSSRTIMLVVALIAALVGGALAWLLVRTITRAVRQVLDAAQGIAEGDLDQHVDVKSSDEIGQMATAFGRMVDYSTTAPRSRAASPAAT
jgi:methyl-accepting chemotaxis protein